MLLLVHALIVPVALVWLLLVLVLDLVEMQVVVLSFVARPSFLIPFLTPLALALALALRGGAVEMILETLLLLRGGAGKKRRSRRAQALDVARGRHSLYRRCAKQR
jgi:MprA protease rhombosortase-interaction domain-containing protein